MGTTYSNVNYSNNIQYLVYRNIASVNHKVGIIPMLEKGIINCKVQGYNNLKNRDTNGILFDPIAYNMIPNIQSNEFYCWAIFDNKILENRYYHLKNGKKIYTDKNINEFTQEIYDNANLESNSDLVSNSVSNSVSNYKIFLESPYSIHIKPYLKYILVMPHKVPDDEKEHHEEYTYFTVREMKSLVKNKYPDAEFKIIYNLDDLRELEKKLFTNQLRETSNIKFNSNTSAEGKYENNMTISIGFK